MNNTKDGSGIKRTTLSTKSHPKNASFQGCVLVVDDSLINQMLMRIMLQKLGFEVVLVGNGQQAVNTLQTRTFDLIFMDMQMPIMDGYEATQLLRSQSISTPIIALTADTIPQDRDKCMEAGCNDFLSKPVDSSQLAQFIEKYLKPISCGITLSE